MFCINRIDDLYSYNWLCELFFITFNLLTSVFYIHLSVSFVFVINWAPRILFRYPQGSVHYSTFSMPFRLVHLWFPTFTFHQRKPFFQLRPHSSTITPQSCHLISFIYSFLFFIQSQSSGPQHQPTLLPSRHTKKLPLSSSMSQHLVKIVIKVGFDFY